MNNHSGRTRPSATLQPLLDVLQTLRVVFAQTFQMFGEEHCSFTNQELTDLKMPGLGREHHRGKHIRRRTGSWALYSNAGVDVHGLLHQPLHNSPLPGLASVEQRTPAVLIHVLEHAVGAPGDQPLCTARVAGCGREHHTGPACVVDLRQAGAKINEPVGSVQVPALEGQVQGAAPILRLPPAHVRLLGQQETNNLYMPCRRSHQQRSPATGVLGLHFCTVRGPHSALSQEDLPVETSVPQRHVALMPALAGILDVGPQLLHGLLGLDVVVLVRLLVRDLLGIHGVKLPRRPLPLGGR
mmetsp:Transcript_94712/g.253306  ORF Transcript_94712/g.253306 Transcript_94712/m.253306 type:complete len:298 (-) Transcript_94712:234-1127(-)